MSKLYRKAFTLVELLIVIGIIGLLAVTLLVAINPQEAQRKTRDAKRVKDAQTLQVMLEQAINDPTFVAPAGWAGAAGVNSAGAGRAPSQACAAGNWTGGNVCPFIQTVPVDPANTLARLCATTATTTAACTPNYQFRAVNGEYEIRVRQESTSNFIKTTSDGGDDNAGGVAGNAGIYYEIGTNLTLL